MDNETAMENPVAEKPEKRKAASKGSLILLIILAAALIILSRHFNAQALPPMPPIDWTPPV